MPRPPACPPPLRPAPGGPAVLGLALALGLGGCGDGASVHGQRLGVVGLARQVLHADRAAPVLAGVRAGDGSGRSPTRLVVLHPSPRGPDEGVVGWCAALAATCSAWSPADAPATVVLADSAAPQVVHLWARDAAGNVSLPVSTVVRLAPPRLARQALPLVRRP